MRYESAFVDVAVAGVDAGDVGEREPPVVAEEVEDGRERLERPRDLLDGDDVEPSAVVLLDAASYPCETPAPDVHSTRTLPSVPGKP